MEESVQKLGIILFGHWAVVNDLRLLVDVAVLKIGVYDEVDLFDSVLVKLLFKLLLIDRPFNLLLNLQGIVGYFVLLVAMGYHGKNQEQYDRFLY